VINLAILAVVGTFNAMGEEIGWRRYLQPRLDAAGVRGSLIVVWIAQLAYHAPLIAGAGYSNAGGLAESFALFAAGDKSGHNAWWRRHAAADAADRRGPFDGNDAHRRHDRRRDGA